MDRASTLPDRCIACNAPAGGYRLTRKLYYSPAAWKIGASLAPFLALLAGAWLEMPALALAFWPLVVVLVIANLFVRKSLRIEIAACNRHREMRLTLITLSWVCMGAIFLGMFSLSEGAFAALVLLGSIGALLILVTLQSILGVQAVRLRELSGDHVWISGTGERFRAALPELN